MDMFTILMAPTTIALTFFYLWWSGHKGNWALLASKFPGMDTMGRELMKSASPEGAYLLEDEKWKGSGWNSMNITVYESAIVFEPTGLLKFLSKPVSIPWTAIRDVTFQSLFSVKKTTLEMPELDIKVLISSKYFEVCKTQCELERKIGN